MKTKHDIFWIFHVLTVLFRKNRFYQGKKKSDMDKNINLALKYGPLQYAFIEICELES